MIIPRCVLKSNTLNDNLFQCINYNKIFNLFYRKYVCDGDIDCPNGLDESNCTCKDHEFRCNNGMCIMKEWLNDGIDDCLDASDENVDNSKGRCNGRSFR